MFPTSRAFGRVAFVLLALASSAAGCGEDRSNTAEKAAAGEGGGAALEGSSGGLGTAGEKDPAMPDASAGAEAQGLGGASYATDEEQCVPGLTRCHGELGFQRCSPDGTWGQSQSCSGYSDNGTSSYCAYVDSGEATWAACVDPACWWWSESGLVSEHEAAGVCVGTEQLRPCHADGILGKAVACAGTCRRLGQLDGREIGYCDPECTDGERECLEGPLYRECVGGRWSALLHACEGGETCQPRTLGEELDVQCGGACEAGTSRCTEDHTGVETCNPRGEWLAEPPCLLGRCVRRGAQAQCQMECQPGEVACGFDGATEQVVCGATGLWNEPESCPVGTSCRIGTQGPLGCRACVGAEIAGGNAWGVVDSRCVGGARSECDSHDAFATPELCPDGQHCVQLQRQAATLAYCR